MEYEIQIWKQDGKKEKDKGELFCLCFQSLIDICIYFPEVKQLGNLGTDFALGNVFNRVGHLVT